MPPEQGFFPQDGPRSIMDNAKQWVGGAIFGLAIFAGILISQRVGEEPVIPLEGVPMVGVSVN